MSANAVSVAKWATDTGRGDEIRREQVSGYYLASSMAADYGGAMIAIPAAERTKRFDH